MEYVDGGASIYGTGTGYRIIISKDECADAAAYLAGGSITAGGVAAILGLTGVGIPYAIGLTVGSMVMGLGSAYMWYCSNRNGFYYNYNIIGFDTWGRIN